MNTRRDFLRSSCIAAAAFSAPSILSAADKSAEGRPNILFIMTDQQFADAMSCSMGTKWLKTPAMDSLAETGALFSNAYTPNPLCMPARNSIFTGRYPHETGVTANKRANIDTEEFLNMGNYFLRAGYETAYFGKWHLCFKSNDVKSHGFQTAKCLHGNGHDDEVGDLAEQYLASKQGKLDKPLMTVVSLSNPHDICQFSRFQKLPSGSVGKAPPADKCPPLPANLAPPINETDTITKMRKGYQGPGSLFPVGDYTDDQWRQLRWGYYRLVEKVDGEIAKVLQALAKSGHEKNTLVIFTSDHGDCAGAHRFNQKTVFYDESARIPFIVRQKGRTAKRRCDKLVNIGVDILPTMLDYAGISIPKKLPGRSVKPLVEGKSPADWPDHIVIQNNMVQSVKVNGVKTTARGRMVRSEQYKYCVYDSGNRRESLVDMKNDPLEKKNIAGDPSSIKIVEAHRKLLLAFADKHNDTLAREMLKDGVGPKPFKAPEATKKKKKKRRKQS